mmetsp:Transcript_22920/g.36336  ORF Transcript_22920/g.36336 Transcript_22920/m.36336 type:complete len:247 (-) Transcript_22920:147-887(-)
MAIKRWEERAWSGLSQQSLQATEQPPTVLKEKKVCASNLEVALAITERVDHTLSVSLNHTVAGQVLLYNHGSNCTHSQAAILQLTQLHTLENLGVVGLQVEGVEAKIPRGLARAGLDESTSSLAGEGGEEDLHHSERALLVHLDHSLPRVSLLSENGIRQCVERLEDLTESGKHGHTAVLELRLTVLGHGGIATLGVAQRVEKAQRSRHTHHVLNLHGDLGRGLGHSIEALGSHEGRGASKSSSDD